MYRYLCRSSGNVHVHLAAAPEEKQRAIHPDRLHMLNVHYKHHLHWVRRQVIRNYAHRSHFQPGSPLWSLIESLYGKKHGLRYQHLAS